QLKLRSGNRWKAAIGMPFTQPKKAHPSYRYADYALRVGTVLFPEKDIYLYDDLRLPILLYEFKLSSDFSMHYQDIVMEDECGDLQNTLETYIHSNGELSDVANKLFIHRNTLRYRLDKIKRLTGKDPRNIQDLLNLYIEQLAYKLNQ